MRPSVPAALIPPRGGSRITITSQPFKSAYRPITVSNSEQSAKSINFTNRFFDRRCPGDPENVDERIEQGFDRDVPFASCTAAELGFGSAGDVSGTANSCQQFPFIDAKFLGVPNMSLPCFDRGANIVIHYPLSTHVRFWRPDQYQRRELVIDSVRDLYADPLTVDEFRRRPFILRSRWLVKAYEPRLRQWRQFYWGSTREFAAPGILRVGLYLDEQPEPSWVMRVCFRPAAGDRKQLLAVLAQWERRDLGELRLRVFADDLPAYDKHSPRRPIANLPCPQGS